MVKFKKVEFLYEVEINLLLELGDKGLFEEVNVYYWEQLGESQEKDILDMRFHVDSCDKEKETITIRIVGYLEDEGE